MEKCEGKIMNNKITIQKMSYSVGDYSILHDICLSVEQNQFVGLIGPNGSGKTTLLKHIYRALPPEKSTVFINRREIESFSYRETAKQITVMRQENGSDFDYTILEMVLMGRAPYRKYYEKDSAEDKQIAINALKYVGMEHLINRSFSTLSGGEKQRVLIARSLTQEADILVLDEPTNHLDVHYQWLLMEVIAGLGKTVLSVFHELNLACAFCDELYVLKDGLITCHGSPAEVCTPELLAGIFGVKADVIQLDSGRPYIVYRHSIDR